VLRMNSWAFATSSLPCHWLGHSHFIAEGNPVCRHRYGTSPSRSIARTVRCQAEAGDESSRQAIDTRAADLNADAGTGTGAELSPEEMYDPVAARVRQELAEQGISLDDLLDAGKVVSLTRELDELTAKLEAGAGTEKDVEILERRAAVLRAKLVTGKRQVMQQWLKQLFLAQAGVFIVLGGLLSSNHFPGVAEVPLVGQALGFWMTWLFVIPSLRARKGLQKDEKSALNVAFVSSPLVNVALPLVTKDCGLIWASGMIVLAAAYARYGAVPSAPASSGSGDSDADDAGSGDSAKSATREQGRIKGILKFLDWGSWR
jgi:hypothetical protein